MALEPSLVDATTPSAEPEAEVAAAAAEASAVADDDDDDDDDDILSAATFAPATAVGTPCPEDILFGSRSGDWRPEETVDIGTQKVDAPVVQRDPDTQDSSLFVRTSFVNLTFIADFLA